MLTEGSQGNEKVDSELSINPSGFDDRISPGGQHFWHY
jgi:hypothetical protein